MEEKIIVTSTASRPISFGGFVIGPGEEKELPAGLTIPEEFKSHIAVKCIRKEERLTIEVKPSIIDTAEEIAVKTDFNPEGLQFNKKLKRRL